MSTAPLIRFYDEPMNNIYVYRKRANMGDNYASSVLAKELGITKFLDSDSDMPPRESIILNWGISKMPQWDVDEWDISWINDWQNIKNSSNKICMLHKFTKQHIPTLCWAQHNNEVFWSGDTVVRHQIYGHSGNGIEIVKEGNPLPEAKLYTRLEKFEVEQRYFVVSDKVVDVVQKKRMGKAKREALGINLDPIIKSRKHGWIFAHNDIVEPIGALNYLAVKAIESIGLDFGVVDIAFNDVDNPKVIEVNSAPGLRSKTTITKLADALRSYIEDL